MAMQLEDTGERMIPEHHKGHNIYGVHLGRYQAGLSLVEDKVVLDIACGSGYGTKLMAGSAKKVYGVDVDRDTITYAQENFGAKNIEYKKGDGTAIPLENDSVDMVVSYETIEHIKDYEKFMVEIKRVLKPSGTLLLSTPNDIEYAEGNHFHLHEFVYDELKSLVKKYFKHHEDYFQTLWLYSSILPENLQTAEWQTPINTINTAPLKPEQCIYFFLLCSDVEIKDKIEPQGVIGEHFRLRDLQARENKFKEIGRVYKENKAHNEKQKKVIEEQKNNIKTLNQHISLIKSSKTWKLASFFQKAHGLIKHPFKSRDNK